MKSYDAVVIGGGPSGITAALYLLRSGVSVLMIEKLSPGGQVLMTSEVENYPGFPKGITGFELADLFAAHLEDYPLERISDEVREIRVGDKFHEIVVGEETVQAKTIIACTGAKFRALGVDGEAELTGKGVSYCALCDGGFFRDRVVAVVGGGNTALEESLYLSRLVKKLYLIHRRDEFRGDKIYQDKCEANPKIEYVLSSTVEKILGDGDVAGVEVKNLKDGSTSVLDVNGVFIFVGYEPQMDYLPEQVEMDAGGVITDTEMSTSVPGIFAAGDIRKKQCRQITSAVGDGATAATAAFAYLERLDA